MEPQFTLALTQEEKKYLLQLAELTIVRTLSGGLNEAELPPAPGEITQKKLGAFVTLHKNGQLRGCIGRLVGDAPLYLTVARMARAAAFHDTRFSPVRQDELAQIHYEISIMGPITPCRDPQKITLGRHGLIMKKEMRQGLLLPQVPVEWGWSVEEFLRQTCHKAGLPPEQWKEAWKENSPTELHWFETVVFKQVKES